MKFFDSEVVRAEMTEIAELQEEVYVNVFRFPYMTLEDQKNHIDLLEKLVEKQKVLYARLSLSNDPEAKKMQEKIRESASTMGIPSNVDISVLFNQMTQTLTVMKKQIDNS
jgi:uncharacterized protein HemX